MGSSNDTPNFGKRFAVLNLDWMHILTNAIQGTDEGKKYIHSCSRWNDAVHQLDPRPLTVFSTLAFTRGQPEVEANKPFARLIFPFGSFEAGSKDTQIDSRFLVDDKDIVLQKTRWSATTGSSLEQILKAQGIDTVVISGLSLSGAVMSTIYRLFDLDYNIFVISDNVVELPVDQTEVFSKVLCGTLLPKMNLSVVSLEQALTALIKSR
ncbi:Isochorismatase hydrolase [Penicillium angulare]|uniref:Isochorismatase hydrolase n=1 Tax=Penicillium angulare TaxID=116970 RepID=UPI002541408E|nr:Isochorismatase hydrolase [Penicillium angulare]KAJ5281241.1 Isochorismatase hydrolase [Penicillium angulare]